MIPPPPRATLTATLCPYTTLFRSAAFSTSGLFNARYTRSRGAAIRSLPVISMAVCSPTVFSPLALKLTKVGGRAKQTHIAVPASPSRRVVIFACGRAAAAPALFHNPGDDGKGDLLRRDGADVEAGGRAQTGELRGIEALFLQPRLQHTSLAPAADESDVGRVGGECSAQCIGIALALRLHPA